MRRLCSARRAGDRRLKDRGPVVLDLHVIGENETGNETYALELARALVATGGDYIGYSPHPEALPPELHSGLRVRVFPAMPAALRIALLYPRMLRQDRAGLVHVSYISPPGSPCPAVVTVHDLTFRLFPSYFRPRVRAVLNLLVGPSLSRAARILVPSESARSDLLRLYPVAPERVLVTPEAAHPRFRPMGHQETAAILSRHSVRTPYVLAVGNLQPRKNLVRLVRAFAKSAAESHHLVVVGRSLWRGSEVEAEARRLAIERRVIFTGYVPADDLPALYAGADVFCYPSLYEGFGLPPLEAMACGVPVVTSAVASLPEVVGDSALTVDPRSVDALVAALRRVLEDADLRGSLVRAGRQRAATFSWERTARLTRAAYDVVLEG